MGLLPRAHSKVSTYSLGMKQRLALAAALVHDPELLILDEPTNGLDPAGIREVRELIRQQRELGRTVFLSSHLLSEVQQTCTHLGILKKGRLLAQGPTRELLRRGQGFLLVPTDAERALAILSALDWVREVRREDDRLFLQAPPHRAAEISRALAQQGIYLSELRPLETSLEEFFLEVTAEEGT